MSATDSFKGGVAVITGAGSGIGEALAMEAAEHGMTVIIAELSVDRGEKVAAAIIEKGGKAQFIQTDVSKRESIKTLADRVHSTYGAVRLLINNAGIAVMGRIWEVTDESWDKTLDINLRGTVACIQYFVPHMIESGQQAFICNLGSLASFSMATNQAPYFCTKHAVLSLSESLYLEMQENQHPIHVAMAAPGMVSTRIFEDAINTKAGSEMTEMLKQVIAHGGMPPNEAAKIILDGIAAKKFVVSTHPAFTSGLATERSEYLAQVNERLPVPSDAEAILETS